MNKIYDNDFKNFFKYVKEIKELPPIPKNFNTKHLQDFINEFENGQQENERLKDKFKDLEEWLEAMASMYENEYKDVDASEHYKCMLYKLKEN